MTLNGVMAVILRYFTEIGSFWGLLRKAPGVGTQTLVPLNFSAVVAPQQQTDLGLLKPQTVNNLNKYTYD